MILISASTSSSFDRYTSATVCLTTPEHSIRCCGADAKLLLESTSSFISFSSGVQVEEGAFRNNSHVV
jgi:hypothetical protein